MGPSLDSDLRVRGVLDLDGVRWGVMHEFHQALAGLVNYSQTLPEDSNPINFKFLKAGMGFLVQDFMILILITHSLRFKMMVLHKLN